MKSQVQEAVAAKTYRPLNDYVLVRPIIKPVSDVLIESEYWQEKSNRGIVIAVGESAGDVVHEGDLVLITKYGMDVELDGEKFVLVRLSEIYLCLGK